MSAAEQADSQETAKEAAEHAYTRGAYPHVLDGRRAVDKTSTLSAIAEALSFPDYFGHNLDALYDCLTDLAWLPVGEHVLIWAGSDALRAKEPKAYLAIRSVLSDAQRAFDPGDSRRFSVVLTDS
ncbi:barstar family protein [Amycolatopsis sp. H20-H5]|uniref:barstar family protein n=1 Tax=Amycolatopsis sp. H20-H5 TaxID=3046309 RepID=UPI002DB74B1C|nr:barstar family protein [Amycolatopsis sp. H20-H5]MEC3977257.1 barstar family protein [Amycolatopsis sp. H20-H5]